MAFNDGHLGDALKQYVSKGYVQFNPRITDGSESIQQIFDSGKLPPLKYDVQLIVAQNDIVVVYSKVETSEKQMAVVDLLRIRDGVMVEH